MDQLAWLLCSSQKQKKHCLEQSGGQGLTVKRIFWPPHCGCTYTAHACAHAHTCLQKILKKLAFLSEGAGVGVIQVKERGYRIILHVTSNTQFFILRFFGPAEHLEVLK